MDQVQYSAAVVDLVLHREFLTMDISEYDNDNDNFSQSKESKSKSKKKYVPRSIEEDPHRHHAKPRELSQDASEMPSSSASNTYSNENTIFNGNCFPFTKFGLDHKLSEHICGTKKGTDSIDAAAKGMGFKTATKVQSIVIPTLLLPSGSADTNVQFARKNVLIN